MGDKTYHIDGCVIDKATRTGIPGLRVEVRNGDPAEVARLGEAVTDAQGRWSIRFDKAAFREVFTERESKLFLDVYRDGELIESAEITDELEAHEPIVVEVADESSTSQVSSRTRAATIPRSSAVACRRSGSSPTIRSTGSTPGTPTATPTTRSSSTT